MNQRDIEQLSEYLDGRLTPSASARLESRLSADPELASALDAMRESRALLRRMPRRRAPRNFTLTPKMVGRKPPLPRAYPVLRFATALAALFFVFSYAANQVGQLAAPAPEAASYALGGSGGGDGNETSQAPALEAATEAPLIAAAPAQDLATPAPEELNRSVEPSPLAKSAGEPAPTPPLLSNWQIAFAAIAILGAAAMLLLRLLAARKWRDG